MRSSFTAETSLKQKDLTVLTENLLEHEEIYWAQRGRVNWLRRGDHNTKFFNQSASARRRRNLIKKLKNNNDAWIEGNDNLKPLIFYYFQNLFNSDAGVIDEGLVHYVKQVVTEDMNRILMVSRRRMLKKLSSK